MSRPRQPIALTIAGSDSGGGAGIQADLKTFHQFRVYGTTVVTAVTAQNTLSVSHVHAVPLSVVQAQLDAVVSDLRPRAVKTGMLATGELVEVVAHGLKRHEIHTYVLDPVMVATSGDRLLEVEAEAAVAARLVPHAAIVTPNLPEAAILTGAPVDTPETMASAARRLVQMGARAALVKGGHLDSGEVVDLFWDGREERTWQRAKLDTRHTHGTGCTLSAALTACLAHGYDARASAEAAISFVARAIRSAPGLGSGHGPVNHFASAPVQGSSDHPTDQTPD